MRRGFTLLELIVVVIIIRILATLALGQFIRVAERARSAEGRNLVGIIRASQVRWAAEHDGAYTNVIGNLDVTFTAPRFFGNITAGDGTAASLASVTRTGGGYTLTISEGGVITCADGATITCAQAGLVAGAN